MAATWWSSLPLASLVIGGKLNSMAKQVRSVVYTPCMTYDVVVVVVVVVRRVGVVPSNFFLRDGKRIRGADEPELSDDEDDAANAAFEKEAIALAALENAQLEKLAAQVY
jgi:hypothetical protein